MQNPRTQMGRNNNPTFFSQVGQLIVILVVGLSFVALSYSLGYSCSQLFIRDAVISNSDKFLTILLLLHQDINVACGILSIFILVFITIVTLLAIKLVTYVEGKKVRRR